MHGSTAVQPPDKDFHGRGNNMHVAEVNNVFNITGVKETLVIYLRVDTSVMLLRIIGVINIYITIERDDIFSSEHGAVILSYEMYNYASQDSLNAFK